MNQKTFKINALSFSPITPLRTPLETKKVVTWTYEDALAGKCEPYQVGTEAVLVEVLPAQASPKDTVGIYLDVFHSIGGREELAKFAKNNPGKFYDQLLRLLISMEAPKQSMNVTLNIERMAQADMVSLPTSELKRLLIQKLPASD
jgi:hypothetical protein